MNHSHEPRCVAALRTWDDYSNIVLFVHVFFHETMSGLIQCVQNDDAVHRIQDYLQGYCTTIDKDGSQAQTPSENQMNEHVDKDRQCNPSAGEKSKWYHFGGKQIFGSGV